ncbi:hypothetical protein AN191_10465 [Loktanella sp. 5RATIMAR09]|uniref:DUF1801 domain-containing protein n=1 Tax=Loktanella sp. 5RATIMAR09 TaxID=1225655 RepID=UPI0006EBBB27|nr:DUF1801 domain-containing protein [Loktanella sp. 5RATIMAR09]KQI71867.1 hypothetical protein AN191_10465 [Loktanella sp. 5RATIMAR09]
MKYPFACDKVARVFAAFPAAERDMALSLRDLIFEVAEATPEVGALEETLKWGQPSYLTPDTKSGSTLRVGLAKGGGVAVFAHCGTDIISTYAATFGALDRIEGNRAVVFRCADDIAPARLRFLVHHGLTYHLPKATSASA